MIKTDRLGEVQLNNFGSEMIIVAYRKAKDIDVYFPEYDWTARHVRYGQFQLGKIKCPYERRVYSVAYMGEGEYKSSINGKHTSEYITWVNMLKRCYDLVYQEKYPTYIGCTVCEKWLNFQTFAEWYNENYYEIDDGRMALDKDILCKNNKVYSEESCTFVPERINTLFVKGDAVRGDNPVGVNFHKKTNKYRAYCTLYGKQKHLGLYSTPEDAFLAYKTYKEALIKKVANDYIEYIPFNLYQAMMSYEVDIDD